MEVPILSDVLFRVLSRNWKSPFALLVGFFALASKFDSHSAIERANAELIPCLCADVAIRERIAPWVRVSVARGFSCITGAFKTIGVICACSWVSELVRDARAVTSKIISISRR